eukprot:2303082-Rhodomonas_salina.7
MHTRYWLPEEHERFVLALQKFGHKDMKAIAGHVGTRSTVQVSEQSDNPLPYAPSQILSDPAVCLQAVRTHAQKYFARLERHGKPHETLLKAECAKVETDALTSSQGKARATLNPVHNPEWATKEEEKSKGKRFRKGPPVCSDCPVVYRKIRQGEV